MKDRILRFHGRAAPSPDGLVTGTVLRSNVFGSASLWRAPAACGRPRRPPCFAVRTPQPWRSPDTGAAALPAAGHQTPDRGRLRILHSSMAKREHEPDSGATSILALVALIDYAVASLLLLGFMAYCGIGLTRAVLLLPVVLCVQLAFTAGVALLVAMGNEFYADVKYVLELGLVAWMFGTLVRGELPAAGSFLGVTIASLVVLSGAWLLFHRAEFRFAEEI